MHTNNEDAYVGCIAAMVKKLGLKSPIICGASMAGQISLACAIRADEVGCIGTIPLQGSDYLDMKRQWYDRTPHHNQSLFNPEWIYGVSRSLLRIPSKYKSLTKCPDDVSHRTTCQSTACLAPLFRAGLWNLPWRSGHVLWVRERQLTCGCIDRILTRLQYVGPYWDITCNREKRKLGFPSPMPGKL